MAANEILVNYYVSDDFNNQQRYLITRALGGPHLERANDKRVKRGVKVPDSSLEDRIGPVSL